MQKKKEHRLKEFIRKSYLPLFLGLTLLASAGTTGILAYLKSSTEAVTNSFTSASSVDPTIKETVINNVKSNVTINVGDTRYDRSEGSQDPGYSVYVRAAVVVTWQDEAGNVYVTPPVVGTDYTITYNTSNWEKGTDGYWYYDKAVPSQNSTTELITECEPLKAAPVDGYTLNVKIIAQTIQSAGTTDGESPIEAIMNAWNYLALKAFE